MTKPNTTDITIVLDRSGSMVSIQKAAVDFVNEFVGSQKEVPGEAKIGLVMFDHEYTPVVDGVNLTDAPIPFLQKSSFVPRGWTALHGAIGKTIDDVGRRLDLTPESERPEKVVIVVVTDGEENFTRSSMWSAQYYGEVLKGMVEHQQSKYGWTFVFLGANQDSALTAQTLGIPVGNSFNYQANDESVKTCTLSLSQSMTTYRMAPGSGCSSTDFSGGNQGDK